LRRILEALIKLKKLKKLRFKFFLILLLSSSGYIHASENSSQTDSSESTNTKTEINSFIDHHLEDSYTFTIWHAMGIEFPLPIILIDEGLHVFSSSKFHHGEKVVESKGNFYTLYHNKIYRTNASGELNFDEEHHPTNAKPLDLSITKNVFSIFIFSLLIFYLFTKFAKSYSQGAVPNKLGLFLEPLVLFVRDEIAIPNIGEKHYRKYMGYLLTIFFFIWIINLAGLTPLGINVTGNIAVTFALALMTFLITQFTSKKEYWKHIFWMPGVPIPMKFILAPIELLGVFIKPFALMIRLYANMTAGHIVIMSLIGLLYIFENWFAKGAFLGLTLFLSIIELLVAFLQAYIFTMLTALYFGGAVAEHVHHD